MPIYYVSHVLAESEARYSPLEKNIFTIIILARKLKLYFQAHSITVLTNVPLRQVMDKPDLTGRMTKWVLELSEYEIDFQSRCSLQAEALANFIVENSLLSTIDPIAKA